MEGDENALKRSSKEDSSGSLGAVKRVRQGPTGEEIQAYVAAQEKCRKVSPHTSMMFQELAASPHIAFRDVTEFFRLAGAIEGSLENRKVCFIRPRRWGKSVLGTAWIEFLRGRRDLFQGTWAANRFRKEPMIGVHLDLTDGLSSVGGCVRAIEKAFNDALEKAEKLEGYQEGAKGKRVLVPSVFPELDSQVSLDDANGVVRDLLNDLEKISTLAGRQVAIFVDEYDRPSINAITKPQFNDVNDFFREFYASLKRRSCIHFLLLVGSSNLSLAQFFSGANDIADLSHDARAAAALGYTWEDIERLYGEQLGLLEKLYGLARHELRAKMEEWYNGFRWSEDSAVCVYNPLSVNMFIKTGKFRAHWTETGVPSLLFNKNLFSAEMLRLFIVKSAQMYISRAVLVGKGLESVQLRGSMSDEGQQSVLVAAGILSLTPKCGALGPKFPVWIPNLESRHAAELILRTAIEPLVSSNVHAAVAQYMHSGDALELIVTLGKLEEVATFAKSLAGKGDLIEIHVHQALVTFILAARKDLSDFEVCSELAVDKLNKQPKEKRKWLDLAFRLSGEHVGYAVELECFDRPKQKALSECEGVRNRLSHGLAQLVNDYRDFQFSDGDHHLERLFSCVMFDKKGSVMAYTKALRFDDANTLLTQISQRTEGDLVVWQDDPLE